MAVTQSWNRSKLNGVISNSTDIILKTPIEGSSYYDIPICLDNYSSTPVSLTGLSWSNGGNTITGTSNQLANVKVGSVIVTNGGTSDFASGTYVTAKPSSTTLTVSTNALKAGSSATATTTLTIDATIGILRLTLSSNEDNKIKISASFGRFNGSNATDSNGNGYDEVTYSNAQVTESLGYVNIDLDSFSTTFGKLRTNS